MSRPKSYYRETFQTICFIKQHFQNELSTTLNLQKTPAPLILPSDNGVNDDLNGLEMPVKFKPKDFEFMATIPQSLAKWKIKALKDYGFEIGSGIYTEMNAVRKDEVLSPFHSCYVDQWDWEKIIRKSDRTIAFLDETVQKLYSVIKKVQKQLSIEYTLDVNTLPESLYFIDSQELEDMYPDLCPHDREEELCRKKGAIFIRKIGHNLKSGIPHDKRAPDYDDWTLNGDLIFYHEPLKKAIEISSMGIRVDSSACTDQLTITKTNERAKLPFHKALLDCEFPYTIGGGIGQSRVCMFLLGKRHIGEVQCSIWPNKVKQQCIEDGIELL